MNIDFQWNLTEENFKAMMRHEQRTNLFGGVRFGHMSVEFRCTGGGYDDDYHVPTTDVFLLGEHDFGCQEYFMRTGAPYVILDDEFVVPVRRTLDGFKAAFEQIVTDWVNERDDMKPFACDYKTATMTDWGNRPEDFGEEPESQEIRIETSIGTIVVTDKGDTKNYPGVWIGIERSGGLFDIAVVEVDQSDKELPALFEARIYSTDIDNDSPIFDYKADAEHIDQYLKGEED